MQYLATDGSQFDHLFKDGEIFSIGNLNVEIFHTPGHTPACVCYYVKGDCIFVGDTIFLPDFGTARCDFPCGSAATLWNSIQRILALPDETRLFIGHDYAEEIRYESTIGESKKSNKHVKEGTLEGEFIQMRTTRDSGLAVPRLLYPSVQVNIMAGKFPPPEENGVSYLKLPIKAPY